MSEQTINDDDSQSVVCCKCETAYPQGRAEALRAGWFPYSTQTQAGIDSGPLICPDCELRVTERALGAMAEYSAVIRRKEAALPLPPPPVPQQVWRRQDGVVVCEAHAPTDLAAHILAVPHVSTLSVAGVLWQRYPVLGEAWRCVVCVQGAPEPLSAPPGGAWSRTHTGKGAR